MTALEFSQYLEIKAINWSTLKEARKSMLHYRHRLSNPGDDTTGRIKGRGTHTAVLEPDRFMLDYACYKGEAGKKPIRRGKKWDEFKAVHKDDSILKVDEYKQCLAIRDAVRNHPAAAVYLRSGKAEQVIEWVDEPTGLKCKARLDWISDSGNAVCDLKGVRSAELHALSQEVAKNLYYCQLAFYIEGVKRAMGKTMSGVIIAAETAAPHDVAVVEIDEDSLYAGWETVRELLDKVAACRDSDVWPGRYAEKQTLRLPQWIWNDEEDLSADDDIVFSDEDRAPSQADNAQGE